MFLGSLWFLKASLNTNEHSLIDRTENTVVFYSFFFVAPKKARRSHLLAIVQHRYPCKQALYNDGPWSLEFVAMFESLLESLLEALRRVLEPPSDPVAPSPNDDDDDGLTEPIFIIPLNIGTFSDQVLDHHHRHGEDLDDLDEEGPPQDSRSLKAAMKAVFSHDADELEDESLLTSQDPRIEVPGKAKAKGP